MLVTATLAILAVLSTSVAVWDKITCGIRKTVLVASVLVAISLLTQVVQVVQKREQETEIARQQQTIRDKDLLLSSNLDVVDEASGGAVDRNLSYVVDDDEASIYVFEYIELESKYKLQNTKPITIVDARNCGERLDWITQCSDSTPVEVTKKLIEDLEGAAVYNGKLYLTTSQSVSSSNIEEPQRWLFLELSFDGKIIRATRKLRAAILELLRNGIYGVDMSSKLDQVQVEGLAIDKNGFAYFGFRSPLINGRALVLRGNVEQLFSDTPKLEPFVLDLEHRGKQYGITSLDHDAKLDQILVLGNSSIRTETLPAVIWNWTVKDPALIQHPSSYNGEIFTVFDAPGTRPAKPEIILLPQEDRLHLFFDAVGLGGQLSLLRKGMSVSRSNE